MFVALLLLTLTPSAAIWWLIFGRHAPRPSDTAAVAADRLRKLR